MKNFLKKYLTDEQLKELETKYIVEHPEAKELPIHISKARLDEVIGQKKTAEDLNVTTAATLKALQDGQPKSITDAVDAAKKIWETESSTKVDALKKDFEVTEAIYKVKGRNIKAIKALVDPTKKIEDEITRLQKDEAYLFEDGNTTIPAGTGKKQPAQPGGGDLELASMRQAVGL